MISDDYFTEDAFNIILSSIRQCKDMGNVYALVFLKYDQDGNNMGNEFFEDNYESTMFDLYFKENITGEKALVFNSNIRKQFEYEVEDGVKIYNRGKTTS